MTAQVHGLLKTRDEAFRSGDKAALKTARANLSRGIKNAKRSYGNKINNHFTNSRDTRSLWQAIQTITDYKPPPQACDDDTSLPDALNHFYSRFEMQNDTSAQKLPTPPNDQALCLSPADVRKIHIWSWSWIVVDLSQIHNDHTGTKKITCVLSKWLPSHSTDSNHNEVLWEASHAQHQNQHPNTLNPLQFAYRPNRSTDDAISYTLHLALTQRFSIPVLAPPRSAHFLCYSYHFRRLFYSNASALRSGHHTIFLHDSSSKRTYSIHSELKCARCEFKLYIFTDVYYVTLVCAWRCCAAQIH